MNYFDCVKPTYIENWSSELYQLSLAQVDVPLTLEEARALGRNIIELGETFVQRTPEQEMHEMKAIDWANAAIRHKLGNGPDPGPEVKFPAFVPGPPPDISDIRSRVAEAVSRFPNGAFVRLGSRSPKDAWSAHGPTGMKVLPGEDPLRFLLDCSERVSDDLQLALANAYAPHIWVRQWVDIPAWSEFRCFMREQHLVGISQYDYLGKKVHAEIAQYADTIEWAIKNFFLDFHRACKNFLDDVVFDVFVKIRERKTPMVERITEVKLLEINPFGNMTDPCLHNWNKPDEFDGSLRYNRTEGAKP